MFTWSVRVGCSFPACWGELVKFQTCLRFLRLLPTLVSDLNFIHLATGLSVNLMACRFHFPTCRLIKQACLYQVKFPGQSVTLTDWVLESGKFVTDRP